jgi:hypothetical protein
MNRKAYAAILALSLFPLFFLAGCGSSSSTPPPPVVSIAATSGTPQSVTVNTAFAAQLVATVTTGGSPTSGVVVTFTAPAASGASGTFAGGVNTATTNASGVATSATFTANGKAGAYTVSATATGASTAASFSLTNTAGAAASIAATSGTPQSATVGTAFAAPLVATVLDSGSNPVNGVVVTFTAPATGASGTFAGGVNTATTNASGVATSAVFTANGNLGAYTVAATVAGVSSPANFGLTNTVGAGASIAATSGTPQSATVDTAFAAPLVATVLDSGSNPVSGVVVTFTAPATGASGTFAGGVNTATTNASGVATSATFTANGTGGGPYTVAATVAGVSTPADFSLTNTGGNYSFYLSGTDILPPPASNGNYNFYALAGSVTINSSGTVVGGVQDYNEGFSTGVTSPEPSGDKITGGTLTVDSTTGQGTLTLITDNAALGVSGTETIGVQFVNTKHALIVQFDGSATSSGSMDLQTLPSTLSGNYAFTLSGVDTSYSSVVAGGVFSISGTAMQNGLLDVDDAGAVTPGTPFTGTISAPDAFGRGTITGTGIAIAINYYIVGPEAIRIIDVDTADSFVGSAFGQGAGAFSDALLGSSVFGVESNFWGLSYAAAGMFTTVPGSGTFQGVADNDEVGVVQSGATISGTYSIASNGYGSLKITSASLGDVKALGIYMTDPTLNLNDPNNTTSGLGGALVADLDTALNGTGVLTPQTDTSPASFAGNYAFGSQALIPGVEFDFVGQGSVAGGALSGTGLVSDPFAFFGASPANYSGVTFAGTASPDGTNAGRYTIPLAISVVSGSPFDFSVVIYQASGGQLFWLDEDGSDVFFGPLEQQGSLTGLPAARKAGAKSKPKRKQ